MKQSRIMSLAEAVANVIVGYGIAVATQLLVFPWFGLPARLDDALAIGAIFTGVSIVRSYTLRRIFEAIRIGVGAGSDRTGAIAGKVSRANNCWRRQPSGNGWRSPARKR
ncbi:DUF7220 family protein [Aquamicrobium defluvii]|uniref:DUF7220 family protein n=1 Tax=Aquamicrobium defluvii TaxID=69279 RepID=UPI0026D6140B